MTTHLTSIQGDDLLTLEALFAKLTPSGWMVPMWLNEMLRAKGLEVRFPGFYIGVTL